jgi:hypothetical protein
MNSFIVCTLHQTDEIKESKIDGECSMHMSEEKYIYKVLVRKPERKELVGRYFLHGGIILQLPNG